MNPTKKQIVNSARIELFKRSYYEFFKYFWSETSAEQLVDNWHIKEICDQLQIIGERIKRREDKEYDLVLNIPPATSKSTIVTVLFPVWLWTIDSSIKILTGSYAKDLSLQHAVKSRTVINSAKFKELYPEIVLKEDQNNKGSYDNTEMGNRTATSVGSGIIGQHYHIQIIDDPITATASDEEIKTANTWMNVTLSTRKISKKLTPTILVMQRIHQSDPSSNMLKKDNVKHICLPATLQPNTTSEYRHHYRNGLLDPIRLPLQILNQSKIELGSTSYAGQYDQNPVPQEGTTLKRKWFNTVQFNQEIHGKIDWKMFIDSAYTEDQENDPSAILICGVLNNTLYIRKSYQYWKELPDLLEIIKKHAGEFKVRIVYVEPKASGKSIVQTLKKGTGLNITELESSRDSKTTKVNSITAECEAGRVKLLEDNWNTNFLDEVTGFPLSAHDDQLDCLVYAVTKLVKSASRISYASS